MKKLFLSALLVAGCVDTTWLSNGSNDLAGTPAVDFSATDGPNTPVPDLYSPPRDLTGTDGPLLTPVQLTGAFNAGGVAGTANGIALRLQFNWNAAIAGTANGIAIAGSFR